MTNCTARPCLLLVVAALLSKSHAFVVLTRCCSQSAPPRQQLPYVSAIPGGEEEYPFLSDPESAGLAAELTRLARERGVSISSDDLLAEDDSEEDDNEEDDGDDIELLGEPNELLSQDGPLRVPEDVPETDSLANDNFYREVKDRVLDTAGGFVNFVQGTEEDADNGGNLAANIPNVYIPPTTVPDPELTAGEVVLLVLRALLNNDDPTKDKGVEILFGYSSPGSQIKQDTALTPAEYRIFLEESEYNILLDHKDATIETGSYSFDGRRAFYSARLYSSTNPKDFTSCSFVLSSEGGTEEDACWMVESLLIHPESMRRRRN